MPVDMSKEEMRRNHRNTRARQQKFRRRAIYAALIMIVVVVALALSFTVFFNVKKFEIRGYNIYTNEQIIEASGVNKGDNLFAMNRDRVAEKIQQKLPFIGGVEFKNSFPDKLVFIITEDAIKCAIDTGSGIVLLDKDSKVLGTVASIDEVIASSSLVGGTPLVTQDKTEKKDTKKTKKKDKKEEESTTKPAEEVTKPAPKAKYVVDSENIIMVEGVEVAKAEIGKTVEFKNEKSFDLYSNIIGLIEEHGIKGLTMIDISDASNVKMMYLGGIEIKVGTVTDIADKMAFAAKLIQSGDLINSYQEGTIDLTIYTTSKKAYLSPKHQTTTKPSTTAPSTTEAGEEGAEGDKPTTTTTTKKHTTTTKPSANN